MNLSEYQLLEFGHPYYCDLPRIEELILDRHYLVAARDRCYLAPATGWLFDGASIPRLLWRVVGPPLRGCYRRGALVHDAGYKGVLLSFQIDRATDVAAIYADLLAAPKSIPATIANRERLEVSRSEIDDIFAAMAIWNGTRYAKAAIMRRAVRMFGGIPWRREHAKWAHLRAAV